MPEAHFVHKHPSDILSYEKIESVAKAAAELGITKVRLTGGEPMVGGSEGLRATRIAENYLKTERNVDPGRFRHATIFSKDGGTNRYLQKTAGFEG